MAVNNTHFTTLVGNNGISAADLEKAMKKQAGLFDDSTLRGISNPCSEIIFKNNETYKGEIIDGKISTSEISASDFTPGLIKGDKIVNNNIKLSEWRTSSDMLSTASGNVFATNISYQKTNSLTVDFDEAVWKIEVPGIEREDINVFTVSDMLYVEFKNSPASRLQFRLDDGETVKSTKLDLGVLTITIDRPAKRQAIEIG